MHTPTESEIAWLAGLFEGEGSIIHRPTGGGRPGYQRRIVIRMSDRDVLAKVQSLFGGTLKAAPRPSAPAHWKSMWVWHVTRWDDIEQILGWLLPHFGERRHAAALALLANPARKPGGLLKTICKRGHPLRGEGADVYENKGVLHCRACIRERRHVSSSTL